MARRSEMFSQFVITNPKQRSSVADGRDGWFKYYAGFSAAFARELIRSSGLTGRSTFMDPWNGSGTSTAAAALCGHRVLGFDINPVMAVVGKARLLPGAELPSLAPLLADISRKAARFRHPLSEKDPLLTWFAPDAAAAIRRLDRAIYLLLVSTNAAESSVESASKMSAMAGFFYVALFRVVRGMLAGFRLSNPTWIGRPDCHHSRRRPSSASVLSAFAAQVGEMAEALMAEPSKWDLASADCTIQVASSECLPVPGNSVDLVLSSPPYCTRIDYGVATSPELAVLGFQLADRLRELRGALIGTPTILGSPLAPDERWGETCNAFLDHVERHPSKAARSYYYKTFIQYFAAISRSMSEISRCLKPRGACVIVVQDSYFKDLRTDLATIFTEMASENKLRLSRRVDFQMSRTMVNINTRSRRYRSSSPAVESVLCFAKH
jgi:hypothetical protein